MYEGVVLCAASSYEEKYYLNGQFDRLPEAVKDELRAMCVLFTAQVGGILVLEFDKEGRLLIDVTAKEGDLLFDEAGSVLKVKQMREEKRELLEALESYFRAFIQDGEGGEGAMPRS